MKKPESNELIAKFMGAEWYNEQWRVGSGDIRQYLDNATELKFDSSWTWLMLVVEEIETTVYRREGDPELTFAVEIHRSGCRIFRSWTTSEKEDFGWHQTGSKFHSVYEAVVEFIEWQNEELKR